MFRYIFAFLKFGCFQVCQNLKNHNFVPFSVPRFFQIQNITTLILTCNMDPLSVYSNPLSKWWVFFPSLIGTIMKMVKMAATQTTFAYILVSETRMWTILMTIPMFSRSRNAMRTVPTALDHLAIAVSFNFKMAATENCFRRYIGLWHP